MELMKWEEDRCRAGSSLRCDSSEDHSILYLNDSKKLTAHKREELYDVIMREAVAVGLGMTSPARIDEINILQATYEAMRQAVSKLAVMPQLLLNDAVTIPELKFRRCRSLREMPKAHLLRLQVL